MNNKNDFNCLLVEMKEYLEQHIPEPEEGIESDVFCKMCEFLYRVSLQNNDNKYIVMSNIIKNLRKAKNVLLEDGRKIKLKR